MLGEATLVFAPDHPAFAGHFPGTPIVPGVLLLDAVVHVLLESLNLSIPSSDTPAICQISAAKFLRPVEPGETLSIRCSSLTTGSTRFDIFSGVQKVATGTLTLTPAP